MTQFTRLWESLASNGGGTIVYAILDGLGGLPHPEHGMTELEAANTPNLDALAESSSCGLLEVVGPGISPGSGPGHLALFGYDPLEHRIGRGVLAALGIDFPLQRGDVAVRVNFATFDADGTIEDRRAGRIETEKNRELCDRIREGLRLEFAGDLFLETVSEHRAALILRGEGLASGVSDTDPQKTGVPPLHPQALSPDSESTARLLAEFAAQAREILSGEGRANGLLLRGIDSYEPPASLKQRYSLKGVCIAEYPMYRGLSRLLGMDVARRPSDLDDSLDVLEEVYGDEHDFFFFHVKKTDSYGEDGDFESKVRVIEAFDDLLQRIVALRPDVLVVTGDHSTPAAMAVHSWHPVPVLIHARFARADRLRSFGESACRHGSLGLRPGLDLLGLALAHAGRLKKYGA